MVFSNAGDIISPALIINRLKQIKCYENNRNATKNGAMLR
nr:MAG TPA: hypothetical protein [Caudoviricetes sp.]